jgi:hypothetical protein
LDADRAAYKVFLFSSGPPASSRLMIMSRLEAGGPEEMNFDS